MEIQSTVIFLLIGVVAGWLAGLIMRGGGFGLLGNMVIGIIGAFVGGFTFDLLGISTRGDTTGSLITALAGAIILLYLVKLIRKG